MTILQFQKNRRRVLTEYPGQDRVLQPRSCSLMAEELTGREYAEHEDSLRWFKHYTDASNTDFIEDLEEKFGLEGYARWWKLLEAVSKAMDNSERCSASHTLQRWQLILKTKGKTLEAFLAHLENKSQINRKQTDNILEIEIPNLLNCRDEYSRKSGHTPDSVAAKNNKSSQDIEDKEFTELEKYQLGRVNFIPIAKKRKAK